MRGRSRRKVLRQQRSRRKVLPLLLADGEGSHTGEHLAEGFPTIRNKEGGLGEAAHADFSGEEGEEGQGDDTL